MSGSELQASEAEGTDLSAALVAGDPLSAHVADSLTIARLGFPNLAFGMLDGRDKISFTDLNKPIKYIRIQKNSPGVLHLHSMVVTGRRDGMSRNLSKDAIISYSSLYPGTEALVAKRLFTRPNGAVYAFHTESEDNAWVEIQLEDIELVQKIEIRNRSDRYAYRSWDVSVLISDNGVSYQTLYSQSEVEARLRELLRDRRLQMLSSVPHIVRECIDNVLLALLTSSYTVASKVLKDAPGISTKTKKLVQKAFNSQFLLEKGAEWTNHGIKRTFRFWSDEEKRSYLEFAADTVRAIENLGYDAVVGYGGVLSLVRDYNLIPHDDDLDVLVIAPRESYPTVSDFISRLEEALTTAGYRISGDYLTHRHCSKGAKGIDLFFGFQEDEFVSSFPGPRRALRRDDVFPVLMCELLGVDCPMPRNPFRYVQTVYGANWRTPLPGWNHTWDRKEYEDWFRAAALEADQDQ